MRKRKRVVKVIFIVIVAVLMLLLIICINHQIHLKTEKELRLPLGQMVEVDGNNMSIYVEGTGDTTLVFMSGGGTCSPILDFKSLYSLLSNKYRIVVVEKFGYGFSDIVDKSRDINSILEVEVKVVSTEKVMKKVFLGQDVDMSPEEIEERLKTLSYLKIHPRDREENKYLLLRGERVYEESLGDDRLFVETAIRKFEKALNTYDQGIIEEAKAEFKRFLEMMEE